MTSTEIKGYCTPLGIGASYRGVVVLGGRRTPFGGFTGSLARVNPIDLGIMAGRSALEATGVTGDQIDQVVFANVAQSGPDAYYLARHIGLYCRVPVQRPALMVQRICGSGFETMIHAAEQICLGKAQVVLAGGTENMSLNPLASFGARMGHDLGKTGFVDTLWAELYDPACGFTMGQTAENLAEKYGITRDEVDRFAIKSQENYAKARESEFFSGPHAEISPVSPGELLAANLKPRKVKLPRGMQQLSHDEHPRETNLQKLAKLPTVFNPKGVQTAGNSSGIVDGACAVVLASEEAALKMGIKPLGRLLASFSVGVPPEIMGIGPAPAMKGLAEITKKTLQDIDLFEINEAFAAQCLAVIKEANLDPEKVNTRGGAIAMGHPLAATGTRLSLTLLRQLKQDQGQLGIAGACIGGGQGTALLLENYQ